MTPLRTHRYGIVFALLVGAIAVAPTVIAPLAVGEGYRGVQAQFLDDEDIYRTQIRQLMRGSAAVATPYLEGYAQEAQPVLPVYQWLYAVPALAFGLSAVVLAAKFFVPALLFVFVYLSTLEIARASAAGAPREQELVAITAGLAVTLGYDFVDYHHVIDLLRGLAHASPLVWTRLVNPGTGALAVFATLWLALRVAAGRGRYSYLFLAIALAASIGYYFSLGMALALAGSILLALLAQKEYRRAGQVLFAMILGMVLDAWYWLHASHAVGGAAGQALALRNGMTYTHAPVLNVFLLATTLAVGAGFFLARAGAYEKQARPAWFAIGALLLAAWIAFNEQVLTGREIWYPHFVQYAIPLCYVALLSAGYLSLRHRWPKLWRFALYAASAVFLAYGLFTVTSASSRLAEFRSLQDDATVFSILDRTPGCVALVLPGDSTLERLIPAYTPCAVYSTTFDYFGIPQERILHNYFLQLRLEEVEPQDVHAYLLAHETEVRMYFFQDWKELFAYNAVDPWFLSTVDTLSSQYQLQAKSSLKDELLSYRMDYLITAQPLTPRLLRELPGLHVATTTPRFYLYAF